MITVTYIPQGSTQTIRSRFQDNQWEKAWDLYEEQEPDSYYIVVHLSLNATNSSFASATEEVVIAEAGPRS